MPEPVRYVISFPEPATHYALVEALLPSAGRASVEVFLPVWTPGSYLIREYSRHLEGIEVTSPEGKPLEFSKVSRNRWRFQTEGQVEIRFSYRVYCREMSVRSNWVEDSFALLAGAATFVTLTDGQHLPHDVTLILPDNWKTSMTGLSEAPDLAPHHYLAPDYDTLIDSPITAGNPEIHFFRVAGIPHYLVNEGGAGDWDGARAASDVEKFIEVCQTFWGSLPYQKYLFLNMITEAGGGLEHHNSVCMMTSRWSTSTRKAYLGWLDLASHEFFHVWNVKRLRQVELGPLDYENENYRRCLWVAEGVTDYYASLIVRRAGLSTPQEYLTGVNSEGGLSGIIQKLQTTPGRLAQSLEEASFDAWIKLYRPDENTINTTISYYTKGTVVAWLLDARIRRVTGGAKSLDDLMRLAYARWSGERGFTAQEFKAAAEEIAGVSLREFFSRNVETAGELDYSEALEWFGLRFKTSSSEGRKGWFGIETKVDGGRLVVTKIPRSTPAWIAGINVDDEILALDDYRVKPDQFSKRLENYLPGREVSVLVARREKLQRINVTLGEEPGKQWQLEQQPEASAKQRENFRVWLNA